MVRARCGCRKGPAVKIHATTKSQCLKKGSVLGRGYIARMPSNLWKLARAEKSHRRQRGQKTIMPFFFFWPPLLLGRIIFLFFVPQHAFFSSVRVKAPARQWFGRSKTKNPLSESRLKNPQFFFKNGLFRNGIRHLPKRAHVM